ncbi:MAG: hypothetical protein COX38_02580, partial [Candidatus Nealsonbacteria bacterium CG23_combo_of_CG06-09_8_20_14_all_39_25]
LERIKNGDEPADTDDNSQDFILNNNPSPTNSSGQSFSLPPQEVPPPEEEPPPPEPGPVYEEIPPLAVVINEVAWMGTKADAKDEWLELFNNTEAEINLTNSKLKSSDPNGPEIILNGIVPAQGFYLIERTDNDGVIPELADLISEFGNGLSNTNCEVLSLYDSHDNLIDQTVCLESGDWPAGQTNPGYISMERIAPAADGTSLENWANNNLITRNGVSAIKDGIRYPIYGTPKEKNSVATSPTFVNGPNLTALQDFSTLNFPLNNSPYFIVDGLLSVPEAKTLTIEAGATLKFDSLSGLIINGTLKAIGAEENKITFTRLLEEGIWGGIYFSPTSINSELNYALIQYAKYGWEGPVSSILVENSSIIFENSTIENYPSVRGLRLVNSHSLIENLNFFGQREFNSIGIEIWEGTPTITNSFFKNNYYGIFVPAFPEGKPLIENNNFEENEYPIWALPQFTFKENQGQNNTYNNIFLSGLITNEDLTLFKNPLSYATDGPNQFIEVSQGRTLTIEPGVIMKFGVLTRLEVKGQLLAQGTSEKPITFTSLPENSPGYWTGIHFHPQSQNSILENVILENGGCCFWPGTWLQTAIYIEEAQVSFTNLTLRNSAEVGLLAQNSNSIIKESHFINNKIGIRIEKAGDYPRIESCYFEDNEPYDIYWQNGGEDCENLKVGNPEAKIECSSP